MEKVISDSRPSYKGRLPPVVEWGCRVGTPVTAGMVAKLRGGGKDFGSEVGVPRAEGRGQPEPPKRLRLTRCVSSISRSVRSLQLRTTH